MAQTNVAVVMGDLVSSERPATIAQVHRDFNDAVDRVNRAAPDLASPLTITLGDEFQGLATSLAAAIAIVRELRFDLMEHRVDCRFVVGVADIQTPINPDRAWNMMGPGLGRARAILGRKRDTSLYLFSLPDHPIHERNLTALGAGLTAIERRWTLRQREDIVASLRNASAEEIAQRRNVAAHSVYKVRSAGQFDAYATLWDAIDVTLAHIDAETGR